VPRYDQVIAAGVGHWLRNPSDVAPDRVAIE
jgi:hypothetical protein